MIVIKDPALQEADLRSNLFPRSAAAPDARRQPSCCESLSIDAAGRCVKRTASPVEVQFAFTLIGRGFSRLHLL
jgi:hypothetical protein